MTASDRGFSLIETLVALSGTAMLSLAGTQLMLQTMRAGDAVEAKTEAVRALQITHSLLKDDISHAVIEPARVSQEGDLFPKRTFEFAQGQSGDELMSFIRSGWTVPFETPDRSDLQYVTYTLADGVLMRNVALRPDPIRETPSVSRILLTGIAELSVRYRIDEDWIETVTPVSALAVEALEVTFSFTNETELVQTFKLARRAL